MSHLASTMASVTVTEVIANEVHHSARCGRLLGHRHTAIPEFALLAHV